jgi:hypothetical protein
MLPLFIKRRTEEVGRRLPELVPVRAGPRDFENLIGTVRHVTRDVKRRRDGRMIRGWVGLGLGRAATRFRRIKRHHELDTLAAAPRKKGTSEAVA